MLERFIAYIHIQDLFQAEEKILLGVSGGLDSVVLAHLFFQAGYDFAMAHCNFQLRGDESDGDEVFVRQLAGQYQVPYYVQHFPTKKLASELSQSTQMLARELRYQWFEEIRVGEGFDYLATAHHLSDSVETLWLNLIRGTGIAGLHGILPKNEHIIRPLLFATRDEIYQYATDQQLEWREDSSNSENYYRRNLLRNKVMPLLKKLNPNLERTLEQNIEKFRGIENIFRESISSLREEVFLEKPEGIFLDYRVLVQKSEPLIRLFYLLEEFGFNLPQCKAIWESMEGISGKTFYSSSHELIKDRAYWIVRPISSKQKLPHWIHREDTILNLSGFELEISYPALDKSFVIPKNPLEACLDLDRLHYPLLLRPWQEGDYFYPLGMQHRQKVSDFLINAKVPLSFKADVRVLCSGEEIVWLVGYRIDDRFKISTETQRLIWLKKIPHNADL